MNRITHTLRNHKKWTGVGAFLLIATTSALAAWLLLQQPATGQGHASSLQPVTITPSADQSGVQGVFPGSDGDVAVVASNPNGAMVITAFAPDGPTPVSISPAAQAAGCFSGAFSVNSATGLNLPVAAGTSRIVIPGALHMSTTSPSSCQNVQATTALKVDLSTP